MQIDVLDWFKFNYLTSLILLIRIICIVDTSMTVTQIPNRQMCIKIQSMLSMGKYHTYQMSSNVTYVSRIYAQNFLAYSPFDNILIFIEPKHELHVYNPQSIRLIINIPANDIIYATSCASLTMDDEHGLYFISEKRLHENLISLRICEMFFDRMNLKFQDKKCIDTLIIRSIKSDIRINGFTIKRDHAGTKKSLLFISSEIGLIYTIFDTKSGLLFREPVVLNDTLNEGSVVVTSTGVIYYANKQEHTIHELHIIKDFRVRYGKIIKSNAIKSPFGLITDECNHLYISTKSMILVMVAQSYKTIRSIFSKASDLPITIERLNSTTYVYATVKKYSTKGPSTWMFNYLYFTDPEKPLITTRLPVISIQESMDFNDNEFDNTKLPKLWPISGTSLLLTTNAINLDTVLPPTLPSYESSTTQEQPLSQMSFTPMSVEVDVTATLPVSSTTYIPLLTYSITTSTNLIELLSSEYLPTTTTTIETTTPSFPITSSPFISTSETTESMIMSDTTEQSSITTFSSESSSYSSIVTASSLLPFTSTDEHFTSQSSTSFYYELSSPYSISSELPTDEHEIHSSSSTMASTMVEPTTTILLETTNAEEILTTADVVPLETTFLPTTVLTSTNVPIVYSTTIEQSTPVVTYSSVGSIRPTRKRRTTTVPTTTALPTTIEDRHQTSEQSSSSTIPSTTFIETTTTTTSPIIIFHSRLNLLQPQQTVIIKPSLNSTSSNTLLSNELLESLFDNSNNSTEKLIFFNLMDLPPTTWNISLHTNQSILLDIVLPSPIYPSSFNSTTNLSITNVEADRFSTNIIGAPVNLQVDQIQAKQFSLAMNLAHNQTNQSLSDVVIGHIKSEQFELNITKSDNMNIHVEQVDSETAELFFDSQFCTNESNLQINLNISKNGTIRYGDRAPLRIGPVFTRVHMLKQSCDLEQPFTLFFDICQGQNPCLNGGTCKSVIPNYDDPSYSHQQPSQIDYRCICPIHTSGEHCQYSDYPTGYCIHGGSLIDDINTSSKICLCPQGFQGTHCENDIDDCINKHCSHHGICHDALNSYTCSCFDGYYGDECQHKNVETILLQAASKSFATLAILLIASIAGLFVASDIHTYLTRKKETTSSIGLPKLPRATSELFENSVLLLGFGDAPIEMNDLSIIHTQRKITPTTTTKPRSVNRKKKVSYQQLSKSKQIKKSPKPPTKPYLSSNSSYETIL